MASEKWTDCWGGSIGRVLYEFIIDHRMLAEKLAEKAEIKHDFNCYGQLEPENQKKTIDNMEKLTQELERKYGFYPASLFKDVPEGVESEAGKMSYKLTILCAKFHAFAKKLGVK